MKVINTKSQTSIRELLDNLNRSDGDIIAVNISNHNYIKEDINHINLTFYDDVLALPKGHYILLGAIETITIESDGSHVVDN